MTGKTIDQLDELNVITDLDQIIVRDPEETTFRRTKYAKAQNLAVYVAAAISSLQIAQVAGLQGELDGKQPLDADLTAIAALAGTGLAARTAADTWAQRTLQAPAAGLTIANPAGVAGNPAFALANDLAALEGLSATGLAVRSASDTWVQRSLANASAGLTWTNGDGVAGNPTPVFANDLGALEALAGTGLAARTAADTWAQRTLQAPAAGLTIANPAGVAGDPAFALANDLAAVEGLGATGLVRRTGTDTWSAGTTVATTEITDDAVTDAKLRNSGALSVIGRSANSVGDPADIATTAGSNAVLRESGSLIGWGTIATGGIANDAVTDAKLRNSGALSLIGRSANSSGDPADIATTAASDAVLRESGSTIGFGTIATGGIANDAVTDAKLRNSGALSVIGRSANSAGDPGDIAAAAASDAVLRESGSVLGFGTIATGGIANNAVTDAKLRQSAGLSIVGRSANTTGNVADIAGADGQVLRVSGTALGFGAIVAAGIADNAVSDAKLRDSGALSVVGRSVNTVGDPADIAATAASDAVLRESGSTIGFGTIATGGIANDAVTDAKLRNSGALSVIGRSANSAGDPADIATTAASDAVLREAGSSIGFGTIATGGIANNAVTDAKLRQSSGLSVVGRSANTTGSVADIVGADGQVLRVSGTALGFGTIVTTGLADDAVTDAKLRNSGALSVIGRSANSAGDPADIAAVAASDAVLRESGSAIGFGTIATGGIANNAITDAKLRQGSALSVIGRSANTTGNVADIAGTDGQVLRVAGTTLAFGAIATAGIADDAVTDAKLRNSAGLSVIGRTANSVGDPADIAGADGQVLRVSGTALGFGAIATAGITDDAVTYAKIQNVSATDRLLGRATAGAGDIEEITCTAFARSCLDDTNSRAFRATTNTRHTVQLKVIDDTTELTTGDGRLIFMVPAELNGLDLVDAQAAVTSVSSSGLPTIQVRNVTNANVDMLSTRITIDQSEFTSYTAATPRVIDTAADNVATGDLIAIDVDVAGTGAGGLLVNLVFD